MIWNATGEERLLVALRHGETDWNAEERFQGQLDIPLNAVGRAQAGTLKLRLAGISLDTAYSSPLCRAWETAQIIAGAVPVIVDGRLTEIHHGYWQGKTKLAIALQRPDEWERWSKEPQHFTPPDGESPARVRARVEDFLGTIQGRNVLCVSHGVVIQTFLSILIGGSRLEQRQYVPANGSVHMLWFRNRNLCHYRIEQIA